MITNENTSLRTNSPARNCRGISRSVWMAVISIIVPETRALTSAGYASEQVSECAVTDSTRTLTVSPGAIAADEGKIAVLN